MNDIITNIFRDCEKEIRSRLAKRWSVQNKLKSIWKNHDISTSLTLKLGQQGVQQVILDALLWKLDPDERGWEASCTRYWSVGDCLSTANTIAWLLLPSLFIIIIVVVVIIIYCLKIVSKTVQENTGRKLDTTLSTAHEREKTKGNINIKHKT